MAAQFKTQEHPLQNGEIIIQSIGLFTLICIQGSGGAQCDITPVVAKTTDNEYIDETQTITPGNGATYGQVLVHAIKITNTVGTGTIAIQTWSA